ncbi:hypothetical protein [Alteromonas lipolytica]|uniref:Uncharacterized protein n=1 Tax=Alteromonas lipolytica TaxID=1856405 RepID=A0A1E8FKZ4_9ALTE|nr:hypothetical protein [Alteromonas lipolytica]OFI36436.1 hypothetical protein BFC17_00720 [Alteromonas lipolytica]GGF69935.1 hypothetical protein GCM10011338_22560 [Alteromonas lipolytica]
MTKLYISILLILIGLASSIWIQKQIDAEVPKIEEYSVVSSYKPVKFKTRQTGGKPSYEITTFTVSDVEFVITENNPFYTHVLSALSAGGKLRVWYKPTDNSKLVYQLSQNNNIVAPFDKLVHINGYSGGGAAIIPILLAIVFVFSWYRISGT